MKLHKKDAIILLVICCLLLGSIFGIRSFVLSRRAALKLSMPQESFNPQTIDESKVKFKFNPKTTVEKDFIESLEVFEEFAEFQNQYFYNGPLQMMREGMIVKIPLDGDEGIYNPVAREIWAMSMIVNNMGDTTLELAEENFILEVNGVRQDTHASMSDDTGEIFQADFYPILLDKNKPQKIILLYYVEVPQSVTYDGGPISEELKDQFRVESTFITVTEGHEVKHDTDLEYYVHKMR